MFQPLLGASSYWSSGSRSSPSWHTWWRTGSL